jgi:hypothetical protein
MHQKTRMQSILLQQSIWLHNWHLRTQLRDLVVDQ